MSKRRRDDDARRRHDRKRAGDRSNTAAPHPASLHVLAAADTPAMRAALVGWFGGVRHARAMPWRKAYDPALGPEERAQRAYEVWVSEVMLQQTQVATVIGYYNRWMQRFPTIRDLAAADIESVNALWKGLGYYSRAARLLAGAQKVVTELGGRLPDNAHEMQAKIPGVGRYSAGAICSIAYGECVPVLDGNVHRLLSRLLALHAPPKAKRTLDVLWAGAAVLVCGASTPGDVNQALIELGSTLCRVRDPACDACPLRPWCRAYARPRHRPTDIEDVCTLCEPLPVDADADAAHRVTLYPVKAARAKARQELDAVHVVEWRTHDARHRFFMLVRRPQGGLLAGLHEFPTVPNLSHARAAAAGSPALVGELLAHWLVSPPPVDEDAVVDDAAPYVKHVRPAGDVLHVFSHIRKTYRVHWVVLLGGGPAPPPLRSESGPAAKKTRRGSQPQLSEGADDLVPSRTVAPPVRWVPLAEVEGSNVGTGTIKVWQLAKSLWERS